MSKLKITLRQDVLKLLTDVGVQLYKDEVAETTEILASYIAAVYLLAPDPKLARQLVDELAEPVWEAVRGKVLGVGEVEH